MNRGVRIIIDATIGLGVAAAIVVALVLPMEAPPEVWMALLLLVFGAVGEYATVDGDEEEGEQAFSLAGPAHLSAAILLLPGWAAVIAAAGSATGELMRRARPIHVVLNASMALYCTLLASAMYHAVSDGNLHSPRNYLAVVAMQLVYVPLNVIPPGLATTMMSRQTLRPLAWLPPADLLAYLMEGCLAAVVALVLTTSPYFVGFIVPLLVAVFLSLKRSRLLSLETRATLRALVTVIDAKDPYTAAHAERVGDLSARLAEAVGFSGRFSREVRWAGRMHDFGKVAVDDAVLRKETKLTESEWESMRRHPAVGAELLEPLSLTRSLSPAIRYHHERADGEGYYLLPGEEIPLQASIISIADAFDAMTSRRSYRDAMSFDDALGRIEAEAGTQFHPQLARAFVAMMRGQAVQPLEIERPGIRGALTQRLQEVRAVGGTAGVAPAPAATPTTS